MTLYAGSKKICPTIKFFMYLLNIDGGIARSIYVYSQQITGGDASSQMNVRNKVDGGSAQWL